MQYLVQDFLRSHKLVTSQVTLVMNANSDLLKFKLASGCIALGKNTFLPSLHRRVESNEKKVRGGGGGGNKK